MLVVLIVVPACHQDIVEVHEEAEVLVVGKSGSKPMIWVAFSAYQAEGPAACEEGLQELTYAVKKKEEEQLSKH